jgi:hypothetical protein
VTEVLDELDAGGRERVAALRAEWRFFWLEASLAETSHDDLSPRWTRPSMRCGRSPRPATLASRGCSSPTARRSASRCAATCGARHRQTAAGSRLRPLWVRLVLTADYLLTFTRNGAVLASAFDALEEIELTLNALAATWTDGDIW